MAPLKLAKKADLAAKVVAAGNLGAAYSLSVADAVRTILIGTLDANHVLTITAPPGSVISAYLTRATLGATFSITDGLSPATPVALNPLVGDLTRVSIEVANDGAFLVQSGIRNTDPVLTETERLALPDGAIATTLSRRTPMVSVGPLTSGQMHRTGHLVIAPGKTIAALRWWSATTSAGSPTNQWACLLDDNNVLLATTLDKTTEAWPVYTAKDFLIASTLGGAIAGSFTNETGGVLRLQVAIMVAAATPPNVYGIAGVHPQSAGAPMMFARNSVTGRTAPITADPGGTWAAWGGLHYVEAVGS